MYFQIQGQIPTKTFWHQLLNGKISTDESQPRSTTVSDEFVTINLNTSLGKSFYFEFTIWYSLYHDFTSNSLSVSLTWSMWTLNECSRNSTDSLEKKSDMIYSAKVIINRKGLLYCKASIWIQSLIFTNTSLVSAKIKRSQTGQNDHVKKINRPR